MMFVPCSAEETFSDLSESSMVFQNLSETFSCLVYLFYFKFPKNNKYSYTAIKVKMLDLQYYIE